MAYSYWLYLKNIFINPVKATKANLEETNLKKVAWISFLIGAVSYVIITILGYHPLDGEISPTRIITFINSRHIGERFSSIWYGGRKSPLDMVFPVTIWVDSLVARESGCRYSRISS